MTNLVTGLTANPPLGNPKQFNGGNTSTTTYATLLTAGGTTLSPTIVDPNFKNSYVESYNLNIQQQLSSKWSVMAGYFRSMGPHLRTRVNPNQFILTWPPAGQRPYPHLNGHTAKTPGDIFLNGY